ncbi:MAG TPA: O-antigen ligase family protein, partial [Polyangia bacterium]|nr:O-antigen ligase family protein [Polyangia bacterium]
RWPTSTRSRTRGRTTWVELARWGAAAGVALGTALAIASRKRERLVDAIQISAALVSAIGLAQHLGVCPLPIPSISVPGSTFGNRNIAAETIAAALPFGLARLSIGAADASRARGEVRGGVAAGFVIVELVFLAVARTRGAWIGGAAGVAAFLAVRRPAISRRLVLGAIVAAAAIAAAVVLPGRWTAHDSRDAKRFAPAAAVVRDGLSVTSPVARTRLGLWRRAWAMYREAPLFGVGPGNFAVLFPRHAEPGAAEEAVLSPTRAPRRAHDDLQVNARASARRPAVVRAGMAVVAAGLVIAAVVWPARRLAASLFLGRAQRALAGGGPGDAARALADLARAARAEPRDFDVALRTAYAASRAGRPADAMAAAQRALAVEPDSPNAWEALARARLEAGDPAGASAAADRALALLHAYPGALYTRAAASRATGDGDGAARARAALAALAAADPQARWLLARLDGG